VRGGDPDILLELFNVALRAVSPSALMPASIPVQASGRTAVIAIGKAAGEMMRIAQVRATRPFEGLAVMPYDHRPKGAWCWPGVEVIEAGHPVPDANSLRAGHRALDLAYSLGARDRLLVLLSGGGSAVAAAPVDGVSLQDKSRITEGLLRSGATVREINCVRKHISALKGGRLAAAAAPAQVATWVISDVPGDDASLVASGPTVADHTDLGTAREIVERYRISQSANIARALADPANETPSPDNLAHSDILVLGGPITALDAVAAYATRHGLAVTRLGDDIEGEARLLGGEHAAIARSLGGSVRPALLLSGGEAFVTLGERRGKGGRNLEYLLALAIALDGAPGISAIACDSDGIDGTSHAAGAMLFPDTLSRAHALGLDAGEHLDRHDSHAFFAALDDLVVTGPTLTNVSDFRALIVAGPASLRAP